MVRRSLLTVLLFGTAFVIAIPEGSAAARCAAGHIKISLFGFEPEAVSRGFYHTVESSGSTKNVFIGASGDACGENVFVNYATSGGTATPGQDYQSKSGTAQMFLPIHESANEPVDITILGDPAIESVVESVQFMLSNPQNAALADPSTAPLFIIDDDGSARVGLEGDAYSQSETFSPVRVPVFRAGGVAAGSSVSYSIAPGATSPATPGADYNATPQGTLAFGAGDRVETIDFSIANDSDPEPSETLTITLSNPSGASLGTTSMTFTILDNEEPFKPESRFHHPRHKWKYKWGDFRIREMHIFTTDKGGSTVVKDELALRRNMKNGNCGWWNGKRFKKGPCGDRVWLELPQYETDFFYYRIGPLRPSIDTRIKNYTAYSRATDGAGNVEDKFEPKRNANTFEVKEKKGR